MTKAVLVIGVVESTMLDAAKTAPAIHVVASQLDDFVFPRKSTEDGKLSCRTTGLDRPAGAG